MKYVLARSAPKSYPLLFERNDEVEAIFHVPYLGPDGERLNVVLVPFLDKVEAILAAGRYAEAAALFLQVLDSFCAHFIVDEYWTTYDDQFDPAYSIECTWRAFASIVRIGAVPLDAVTSLRVGLSEIARSEAVIEYGILDIDSWIACLDDEPKYTSTPCPSNFSLNFKVSPTRRCGGE